MRLPWILRRRMPLDIAAHALGAAEREVVKIRRRRGGALVELFDGVRLLIVDRPDGTLQIMWPSAAAVRGIAHLPIYQPRKRFHSPGDSALAPETDGASSEDQPLGAPSITIPAVAA